MSQATPGKTVDFEATNRNFGTGLEETQRKFVLAVARGQLAAPGSAEQREAFQQAFVIARSRATSNGDVPLVAGRSEVDIVATECNSDKPPHKAQVVFEGIVQKDGKSVQVSYVGVDEKGVIRPKASAEAAIQDVANQLANQGFGPQIDVKGILASRPQQGPVQAPVAPSHTIEIVPLARLVSDTPRVEPAAPLRARPPAAPSPNASLSCLTPQEKVDLQKTLIAALGQDALKQHGADGKIGPETLKALNNLAKQANVKLEDIDFRNSGDKELIQFKEKALELQQKRLGAAAPATAPTAPATAPAQRVELTETVVRPQDHVREIPVTVVNPPAPYPNLLEIVTSAFVANPSISVANAIPGQPVAPSPTPAATAPAPTPPSR
jgi:hypothetical protein